MVAAIALGSCGGDTPSTPPPQAAPSPEQKKALDRADALIADMKKRQAALEQSDRAAAGKAAQPARPAVVEASPPPKPTPVTPEPPAVSRPTSPPIPPKVPSGMELVSSSYTVAERGQAFWRFSWRTSVRNQQRTPIRARVEMELRDDKGVRISAGEQTVNINAASVAEVTGSVMVKAADGPRVANATPRIVLLK